uniref:DNA-directed DNA polymerase n=1 Tax=Macrostomum lignano TaxID=282301 RepID=A0A1I8HEI9_9PLAT
ARRLTNRRLTASAEPANRRRLAGADLDLLLPDAEAPTRLAASCGCCRRIADFASSSPPPPTLPPPMGMLFPSSSSSTSGCCSPASLCVFRCFERCRCSSSDRVNRLPQNSQLHTNGLSPVCPAKVGLQVRGLVVHLAAAGDVAAVKVPLAQLLPPPPGPDGRPRDSGRRGSAGSTCRLLRLPLPASLLPELDDAAGGCCCRRHRRLRRLLSTDGRPAAGRSCRSRRRGGRRRVGVAEQRQEGMRLLADQRVVSGRLAQIGEVLRLLHLKSPLACSPPAEPREGGREMEEPGGLECRGRLEGHATGSSHAVGRAPGPARYASESGAYELRPINQSWCRVSASNTSRRPAPLATKVSRTRLKALTKVAWEGSPPGCRDLSQSMSPRKNEATMRGKRSRTTAISSDISSSSSSKRRSVAADDIEARWEVVEAAAETGVVEAAAAETGAAEAGPVVVSSSTETSKRAAEAVVKSEAVAAGAPFTTPPIASSGSPGYRRRVCLDSLGWRGCLRCRLEELVQTGGKHPAPQFRREFDRVAPIKLWVLIEPIAQQTDPPSRSFNCLEIAQQDPLVHVKAGSSLQVRARSFELLPLWLGQVDCREAVLPHSGLVGVETPNFNQVVFSFKYAFVPPTQPESVTGPGFTARLDNQRDLPKFRAKGVEYVVHITNTEDLREVFADMLEVFKQDLAGDDFMAAKFESDNMLKAAHTPPVRASRMTAELLFKHIDKIVQSDATVLSGNFSIRLLKAWVPRGGCALENKHLEERHAFSKHYVRITNSDKRCLLRALVVACAYLQFVAKSITKRVWHTIKANSPTQTKLVAELQIEAGLYTTLQTVSQAGPFGDPCPEPAASGHDFGVRVYRAEEANRCIFNLPGTEILHLHLVEQHFNVVTKLPAFFGSHHYCPKCEMAYDANPPSTKNHKRKNKAGRSRCDSVHVCGTCGYLEELKVGQPPEHQCGYAKCPVCKQYDETATHECFVTPPKAKESSAPYVYYDFETYVDSGKQHRVHLVTAATSCEACPKLFPRPRCSDEGAPVQQPIRLEDALFGGRTEAFVPHAEATETVELRYRDVVSLYPTVNKFDKYPLKAESSGSPGMAEDAKAAYMASFFEREGVRLEKVEENPGLRFVAKIFLNSLWGKFCQRDDLTSTEIVDSYEAWLQRLTDPSIKVKSCEPIGESFMMLEYKPRFGGAGERAFKYANVPIGVFTTSHARLRLYEALEGLGTRGRIPLLPGEYEPPGGSSLGQWTDEVPAGCRMVQFTTGGPKLYRYVVEKPDGSLYSVLKCKGIRVTPEISEREDELQEILRHGGTVRLPQAQFRRDKASCTIRTLEMDKTFQRVMTKRVYGAASRPYGFRE